MENKNFAKFLDSILPGNYAITKSMEPSKITSSGTLWYLKKFLVLYYFIFLSNDISTKTYIKQIVKIFDDFIDSLPSQVQEAASKFFYPDEETINFKSSNFKTFNDFIDHNITWENTVQKNNYLHGAKKYYFSMLMDVGGQTGIKKIVQNSLSSKDFKYSIDNFHKMIDDAVIKSIISDFNTKKCIDDNYVKYVISTESIDAINKYKGETITEDEIKKIIFKFPKENPKYNTIINDTIAFLRNERQIFYYWGFFHSKSCGAEELEFSSITPVGEMAVNANFYELLVLWEMQKIKMISQSPLIEINMLPDNLNSNNFSISFSPYLDLLKFLFINNSISSDQYQYIVSRKNRIISEDEWEEDLEDFTSSIDVIKEKVKSFGRDRDIKKEDAQKELKKYLLGIRSDFKFDNKTNPIGVIYDDRKDHSYKICSDNKFSTIVKVYEFIDKYKVIKYHNLFEECEKELKNKYDSSSRNLNYQLNSKTKIDWDLYNIKPDSVACILIALTIASFQQGKNILDSTQNDDLNELFNFAFIHYENLFKLLGYNSPNKFKELASRLISALWTNTPNLVIDFDEQEEQYSIDDYKIESVEALWRKIEMFSSNGCIMGEDRKRYYNLVHALKKYYIATKLLNGTLKCECCGSDAFKTVKDEPYVEFHHLIPFKKVFGPDHYLNLYALCPNCHRKIHFMKIEDKNCLYRNLDENNYLNKTLVNRLKELKNKNMLKSFQLEFLLADGAISKEQYNEIAN